MDDVSLPKASVEKIAKECLPANVRMSTPCMTLLMECCSGWVIGLDSNRHAKYKRIYASLGKVGCGDLKLTQKQHEGQFVQLIASEANTISEEEKKKTLNPEHVVKALERLGFASFTTDVSQFLEEVKENDKKYLETKASLKSKHSEMSEEDQIALQNKLFAQARGELPPDPE